MPDVPLQCKALADEVSAMEDELRDLQSELKGAATGAKGRISAQIKTLRQGIASKRPELRVCVARYAGSVTIPVEATISGSICIASSGRYPGEPFCRSQTIDVLFNSARNQGSISSFPPVRMNTTSASNAIFPLGAGSNFTTITLVKSSVGVFDKGSGKLVLPVGFFFNNSRPGAAFFGLGEDSNLDISLSTESLGGARIDSGGNVVLVGTGLFLGGFLQSIGLSCIVTLAGKIAPYRSEPASGAMRRARLAKGLRCLTFEVTCPRRQAL